MPTKKFHFTCKYFMSSYHSHCYRTTYLKLKIVVDSNNFSRFNYFCVNIYWHFSCMLTVTQANLMFKWKKLDFSCW